MSRWLVGSSSRSRCGSETSARPSSARRRQPPDNSIHPALGGQRQPRDDVLDLLLEPPAVTFLEAVLQPAEPLHVRRAVRLRHADGRLVIFRDQRCRARRARTRPPRRPCDRRLRERPARAARRAARARARWCRCRAAVHPTAHAAGCSCRRRCGRSARCARPARSGGPLLRRGEGGQRRGRFSATTTGARQTTYHVLRATCWVQRAKARATSYVLVPRARHVPRARATCCTTRVTRCT